MTRLVTMTLATLAGFVTGATMVGGLHAQSAVPGGYAVIDISAVDNPDVFKSIGPKAGPLNAAYGGRLIMQTETIVGVDGAPPKRFIVIAFDTMDKAKAWTQAAAHGDIVSIRKRSTTSREFLVDGKVP
jgi:uncharacterized protein (DUF1330 family)